MNWTTRGSGWAGLGLLVAMSGCAGGEDGDSGFMPPTTLPSTNPPPFVTDTGEPPDETTESEPTDGSGSNTASEPPETSTTTTESSTGPVVTTTSDDTTSTSTTSDDTTSSSTTSDDTTGVGPACGDGNVDMGEACDDGNQNDGDACLNNCTAATCGDGVVLVGTEACDDGNMVDTDACLPTCVAASCGDGKIHAGVEQCDDGPSNGMYNQCAANCAGPGPKCGDGVKNGPEQCDDGNLNNNDGCSMSCTTEVVCGNPGGGNLQAENGTGLNKLYCYNQGDSNEVRAQKACESHFGVGQCCIIPGGYNSLQYGQCGQGGGAGTYHWHPDSHPNGHCPPMYVIGDVVSPGWCGAVTGNFLD